MSKTISIAVHHLTRVEGHGNIAVNVNNGKIEKCEWQVPEAPRFFEAMVRGRHYSEVARITSRICGICSIGHTLASLKATESALGIAVTPQTFKRRFAIVMRFSSAKVGLSAARKRCNASPTMAMSGEPAKGRRPPMLIVSAMRAFCSTSASLGRSASGL